MANEPQISTGIAPNEQSALNPAQETYNRGVHLFQVAQGQRDKGNVQGQQDLLQKSIDHFEEALKLDPDMVEAQSNMGFAYLTLNKYKDATKAFEKALKLDPHHLNTINGLGTTYALRDKYDLATAQFDTLVKLDPGNVQFRFNRASTLQKAKRYAEAEAGYLDALRLEAQHQASLFNLATLYENQHQLDKALPLYQQVKDLDITSTIGLEAVNRIQWIEIELDRQKNRPNRKGY